MGMFDSLFVEPSLIDELVKDHQFYKTDEGYYSFQTKDLDNALNNYYLEKDGTLFYERQEYELVEEADRLKPFSPLFNPVGDPVKENTNVSCYIQFYDFYTTEDERLFYTFKAHIQNGKLVKPILIHEIEITDLKKEKQELEKQKKIWAIQESTWQFKVSKFIFDVKWRIRKFFYPIISRIDKLESELRNKSKQIAESQFNNK
jgi:hypothetical protein